MDIVQAVRIFTASNVNADNAGIVTLLAANTLVVETATVQVSVGQQGMVQGFFLATKGATAGDTDGSISLGAAATATALFGSANFNALGARANAVGIGAQSWHMMSGFFTVTVAGLLSFRLRGNSQGSNATIPANSGNLALWIFGA